jgi:hypothetical protein
MSRSLPYGFPRRNIPLTLCHYNPEARSDTLRLCAVYNRSYNRVVDKGPYKCRLHRLALRSRLPDKT